MIYKQIMVINQWPAININLDGNESMYYFLRKETL
jgi:hypothetical protein